MGRQTVVLVDGDGRSLNARAKQLVIEGYEVETATCPHTARDKLELGADALVLCSKGIEPWAMLLLRALRAGEILGADPELLVVAVGVDDERALWRCRTVGGVDYPLPSCTSPLLVAEMLEGLCRRRGLDERKTLQVANVVIDCEAHGVEVNGEQLHLTPIEFKLFWILALRPSCPIAHNALTRRLWREDADWIAKQHCLQTHVTRLRRKLAEKDAAVTLTIVRGVGLRLVSAHTNTDTNTGSRQAHDSPESVCGGPSSPPMNAPAMITITLRGRAVAVTLADHAKISDELYEDDRRLVDAMCLYALKIQRGELPGPYTEQGALEFASALLDEIEAGTGEPSRAPRSPGDVEREASHHAPGDAGCNKSVPIQPRAAGKAPKGDWFRPTGVHDRRMDRRKGS